MNVILILFALITFIVLGNQTQVSNKWLYEKEISKRERKQESQTISSYSCDQRSYFKRITQIVNSYFNIECNAVYQGRDNYTAVGTIDDGQDVPLRVLHSCFALRDVNGSEIYSNLGVVMDGKCVGALVYIYSSGKISSGWCNSRNGVTQVEVPKGQALFSIRGTCDSTCWGSSTTDYNPGKSARLESQTQAPVREVNTDTDTGYTVGDEDYDFSYEQGIINRKLP